MKKQWLTFYFLIFLFLAQCTTPPKHSTISKKTDIEKFLASLDREEKVLLEFFFRSLIQDDSIGYVLLGGKPMGFYSYLQPKTVVTAHPNQSIENIDLFFNGLDEDNTLFHKGWEVWKKYASRFCGKNLVFDFFIQDFELQYAKVSVINKRSLSRIFDQYQNLFQEMEPRIKDKKLFLHSLLHDESFKRKFYSRHDLLGICLGYGQNNASLFQQMSSLLSSMGKLSYTLHTPSPDHLNQLEKQWKTLKKSFNQGLKDHTSNKFLFTIGLGFRVNRSNPETAMLQNHYTYLHKKLTQEYNEGSFLQKTLELILLANQ